MNTTYEARLAMGAIWARKQFADEAAQNATKAAYNGNMNDSLLFSQEATRHEKAIMSLMKTAQKAIR